MPRVALGLPLYEAGDHLEAALDSLLAQTFDDFALTIVDDGSTDRSPDVVARVAERDRRIHSVRNPQRLGLIGNWRASYAHARKAAPDADLFAWVGDHDLWDPRWLERLVAALDADPGVVTAYPEAQRLSDAGERLDGEPRRFSTAGLEDPFRRAVVAHRDMPSGDLVYGLHRAGAIEDAGTFRAVLAPDKLLLTELALAGRFAQVPEVLWHRRFSRPWTAERARRTLFAPSPPPSAYVPWWIAHSAALIWHHAIAPGSWRPLARGRAVALALELLALNARRRLVRRLVGLRARAWAVGGGRPLHRLRRLRAAR